MLLPPELLTSLQTVPGYDQKAFEEVHASGRQLTSIRLNPAKPVSVHHRNQADELFQSAPVALQPIPWASSGYYVSQRPSFTFEPLFHAGCYYVQEASSMFLEQALLQTTDLSQPLKVLDVCAAPGGKSTHIQSLISANSVLVSNEVIKSRAHILKQNIIKWGCTNVLVTSNDPQHFSKLKGFFDVMVIDAPCSGSGLFRKDEEAVQEWSKENVLLCCGRQKRILADVYPALKENGLLIYSTCSYSKEEDEDIADWLVSTLHMKTEPLSLKEEWGIVESTSATGAVGYRFFPDKVQGEGFYLACFRKTTENESVKFKAALLEKVTAKEKSIIAPWLTTDEMNGYKEGFFYALPEAIIEDFRIIKNYLNIQYAGILLGEIMKDKLIPDHALAMSTILSATIPKNDVSYTEAIRYLQKKELSISTEKKGWQLVTFQDNNLGWINALPNRINNYYPKELRILKQ